ncbi:hypothetical protein [Paenibacillus sp. IITD108]|uniref:hypothetical protein n=1 Tax=Paenibacillus sp. IITD108 TaxID=3116649 RepID=UPI002F420FD4
MIKKLPIGHPMIEGYPKHANTLSILSQHDSALAWILCNYIQLKLRINHEGDYFDFYTINPVFQKSLFDYQRHSRKSVFRWHGENITKYIIDCIDMDYYIYTVVDEFHIPNTRAYNKRFFPHSVLIYGYDTERQIYNLAGFNSPEGQPQKFRKFDLAFSEFEKAFVSIKSEPNHNHYHNNVYLLRYNNNTSYDFDVNVVIYYLEDYILSKNSYYRESNYFNPPQNEYIFGIEVLNELKKVYSSDSKCKFDVRPLYLLKEHKQLMLNRLNYFQTNEILFIPEQIKQYSHVVNESTISINLLLKYLITNELKLLSKIHEKLDNIYNLEMAILPTILNLLKELNIDSPSSDKLASKNKDH